MKNSQELFSYPIVVIESIWPKLPEEAPKLVGPKNNEETKNAYLYSETQNAFSGYFKVIPLNVSSIQVNSTKDGHNFDITFDPSYVYVQVNPQYISRDLYSYIVRNSFQYTKSKDKNSDPNMLRDDVQDINYLSGILEGYSKSAMERDDGKFSGFEYYFIPGNVISKFINEMDTVTIFLTQDLGIFDQSELIKLAGGSFSRMREADVLTGTKTLTDLGITKPLDLKSLAFTSIAEKLQGFRSLLTNNSIGKYSFVYKDRSEISMGYNIQSLSPTVYFTESVVDEANKEGLGVAYLKREDTKDQEIANINKAIRNLKEGSDITMTLGLFGSVISDFIYTKLKNIPDVAESGKVDKNKYLVSTKGDIIAHYDTSISSTLSWSLHKSLSILFNEIVDISAAKESNAESFKKQIVENLIKTAAIDLYIQNYYPAIYTEILQTLFDFSVTKRIPDRNDQDGSFRYVEDAILNLKKMFVASKAQANALLFKDITAIDYFRGLEDFFTYVIKPIALKDIENVDSETLISSVTLDRIFKDSNLSKSVKALDSLKFPVSCETPYFVLNGHITKISDTSSVGADSYDRSISISGAGFELPMQTHQIFLDSYNISQQALFMPMQKWTLSNATPIAAALSILALHLPDYPQFFRRDFTTSTSTLDLDLAKILRDQRNYNVYRQTFAYFVEKGTVLMKKPAVQNSEYFILAPIHYIDRSYLRIIKSTFDTTLIATNQIMTEQRTISDGSVADNLRGFLSSSSMYSFFIDEFGTLKLRFEPSAVTQTNSTILSPPITDKTLISAGLMSEQDQIYNVVEILPKPFSGTSESAKSLVVSRATPPDVVSAYSLYKPVDFKDYMNSNNANSFTNLLNFLRVVYIVYIGAVEEIVNDWNKTYSKEWFVTIKLPAIRPKKLTYDQLRDAFDPSYETAAEKKKKAEEAAKAKAEADQAEKAVQARASVTTTTTVKKAVTFQDVCADPSAGTEEEEPTNSKQFTTAEQKRLAKEKDKASSKKEMITDAAYTYLYDTSESAGDFVKEYVNIFHDFQFTRTATGYAVIPMKLKAGAPFESYTVSPGFHPELRPTLGTNFLYESYLRYMVSAAIQANSYIKELRETSLESLDVIIRLMATFAFIGVKPEDLKYNATPNKQTDVLLPLDKITNEEGYISNYISWVVKNTTIFYYPKTLSETVSVEGGALEERQSRRLPYSNFRLQEFNPKNISADFFRYGLRRIQQDDFYSSTNTLTDFRAETVRKLHEYPMKTANLTLLLNPMYKVGNTVLFASEHSPNNKGTYINAGLKNMLDDVFNSINSKNLSQSAEDAENSNDPRNYNLILRVDDLIKNPEDPVYVKNNPTFAKLTDFPDTRQITEAKVIEHFKAASDFILDKRRNKKSLPIPSDAYVPLLGIYQTNNKAVQKYLDILVRFNGAPVEFDQGDSPKVNYLNKFGANVKGSYISLYEELEESIINVYKSVYGSNYNPDDFNYVTNLLRPQNYHVYQYHINTLSHSWAFGATAKTTIAGNFGIPALMTYVPDTIDQDFGMHVVGYCLTRGPNFYFDEHGTENEKIKKDNAAYKFSQMQLIKEEQFYKSKYRYNLGYILEKIRRRYLMPNIYGSLLSFTNGPSKITSQEFTR